MTSTSQKFLETYRKTTPKWPIPVNTPQCLMQKNDSVELHQKLVSEKYHIKGWIVTLLYYI